MATITKLRKNRPETERETKRERKRERKRKRRERERERKSCKINIEREIAKMKKRENNRPK